MNETHATQYLLAASPIPSQDCTSRTRKILAALGEPQKNISIVKILGEAGKSTVSRLLTFGLSQSSIACASVSLSPLREPRLAIRIGNAPPTHIEFAAAVTKTWRAARECSQEQLCYEEILLATALVLATNAGCRILLTELSADNKNSAASALTAPSLCILTSSSEKMATGYLALIDTRNEIVAAPQETGVTRLLTDRAATLHCRLNVPIRPNEYRQSQGQLCFSYQKTPYTLATTAYYHINNALVAIEAFEVLRRKGFRISSDSILAALRESTCFLGFRLFSLSPAWLIDVANSPFRLSALADAVKKCPDIFGNRFSVLTEPHLATACREIFGESMADITLVETKNIKQLRKQYSPPTQAPLLAVGSQTFTEEILRTLNALFLFG